jgi:methionine synthase I (cobalamin-dependent)
MTNRKYTNRKYLDALEKKVLVFGGSMGTDLQAYKLRTDVNVRATLPSPLIPFRALSGLADLSRLCLNSMGIYPRPEIR